MFPEAPMHLQHFLALNFCSPSLPTLSAPVPDCSFPCFILKILALLWFINSLNKHTLNAQCVQTAVLGPGETKLKKTWCLPSRSSSWRQMWKERRGLQCDKCYHTVFLQRRSEDHLHLTLPEFLRNFRFPDAAPWIIILGGCSSGNCILNKPK